MLKVDRLSVFFITSKSKRAQIVHKFKIGQVKSGHKLRLLKD